MNPGILMSPTQFASSPRGLLGRPTPVPMIDARRVFDPDAERYIAAVERADGSPLEDSVRIAIGEFVIGCKEDGVWSEFANTFLFCGAKTLSGALVPLVGPAPTNFNFVSGDYNRRSGLKGNGSNKYLLAGLSASRLNAASHHGFFYGSDFETAAVRQGFGSSNGGANDTVFDFIFFFNGARLARSTLNSTASVSTGLTTSGSITTSRTALNEFRLFQNTTLAGTNTTTVSPQFSSNPFGIFGRNDGANSVAAPTGARFAVFSFGGGLSATRVSALHNRADALVAALGVAIP